MKIALRGMHFYAYHGYFAIEQRVGGHYIVDVEIDTSDVRSVGSDQLIHTINYANVYEVVKTEMLQPSKLIETVAGRVLAQLQLLVGDKAKVKVGIHKLNPPLGGEVAEAYVELQS